MSEIKFFSFENCIFEPIWVHRNLSSEHWIRCPGQAQIPLYSHSVCSFTMPLSKSPVNLYCFLCVMRASPIPGDLYIHSQAYLSIVGWWGFLLCGCHLYVTVSSSRDGCKERNSNVSWLGQRVKANVSKELVCNIWPAYPKQSGVWPPVSKKHSSATSFPQAQIMAGKLCAPYIWILEVCSCSMPSLKRQRCKGYSLSHVPGNLEMSLC